jgi:hypothetical protein
MHSPKRVAVPSKGLVILVGVIGYPNSRGAVRWLKPIGPEAVS